MFAALKIYADSVLRKDCLENKQGPEILSILLAILPFAFNETSEVTIPTDLAWPDLKEIFTDFACLTMVSGQH